MSNAVARFLTNAVGERSVVAPWLAAAVLVGLSSAVAAVLVAAPLIGFGLAAFLLLIAISDRVLPLNQRVALPLLLLLLVPADEILPLTEDRRGFFCLAVAAFTFASGLLGRSLRIPNIFKDRFLLLVLVYLLFYAIHINVGARRGAIFWLAGAMIYVWLLGMQERYAGMRQAVIWAIIVSGSFSGGLGILEYFAGLDLTRYASFYVPDINTFGEALGVRAVGLSGHALCQGTLTMLACALLLGRLARSRWGHRGFVTDATLLILAGGGLILSGARGSWLGLVLAALVATGTMIAARRTSSLTRVRLIAGFISVGLVAWFTFGTLLRERLVGSASAPTSIGQRVTAAQTIWDALHDLPFLGVGPGGTSEFLYRWGLIVPNIENEYLITLVACGPLGVLAFLLWLAWITRRGIRDTIRTLDPTSTLIAVTVAINLSTYNMLSWSLGVPIMALASFLSDSTPHHAATPAEREASGIEIQPSTVTPIGA